MQAIGYVRVSTDRQAEQGVSLEAQEAKIRAMATVQGADLGEVIVDGGESAKSLNRPGLQRLLGLVNAGKIDSVIVAKLDRLTRSVKDLCGLLELFEKRKVALISVAESLDTGSAAGRLVITIMGATNLGLGQPGFADLIELVRIGKCYVKISGAYRSSTQSPDYADMTPFARALISANANRIVWGTDWPHPDSTTAPGHRATERVPLLQIDDGRLLNQLPVWAPDSAIRKKILVDNPARLYGF
jgi:hypothetical protein